MELTRLERISVVVEDTLEKLLLNSTKGDDNIYIYRYNLWVEMLHREIENDLNVDTSKLKVSKFMEQIISHYIVQMQQIGDVYRLYRGWKSDDPHNMKFREKKIKEILGR